MVSQSTKTGLGAGNTTISDLETNPEDLPRSLQCWSLNNFFVKKKKLPRELPPWGILDEDYSWQWCAPCKSNQARIGSLVLEWGVFQLKKPVGGWKSSWSGELKGTFGVEFLEKHTRFFFIQWDNSCVVMLNQWHPSVEGEARRAWQAGWAGVAPHLAFVTRGKLKVIKVISKDVTHQGWTSWLRVEPGSFCWQLKFFTLVGSCWIHCYSSYFVALQEEGRRISRTSKQKGPSHSCWAGVGKGFHYIWYIYRHILYVSLLRCFTKTEMAEVIKDLERPRNLDHMML